MVVSWLSPNWLSLRSKEANKHRLQWMMKCITKKPEVEPQDSSQTLKSISSTHYYPHFQSLPWRPVNTNINIFVIRIFTLPAPWCRLGVSWDGVTPLCHSFTQRWCKHAAGDRNDIKAGINSSSAESSTVPSLVHHHVGGTQRNILKRQLGIFNLFLSILKPSLIWHQAHWQTAVSN